MPDTLARLVELARRIAAVFAEIARTLHELLPAAPMLASVAVHYLRHHGRPELVPARPPQPDRAQVQHVRHARSRA